MSRPHHQTHSRIALGRDGVLVHFDCDNIDPNVARVRAGAIADASTLPEVIPALRWTPVALRCFAKSRACGDSLQAMEQNGTDGT
jgi:hypothetical protein